MASLIEQFGGPPQKQPKYAPIFLDRSFTGLFTQRAVLHDPADIVTARYYGGRPDALWAGRNIELTNRLTLQRRPGLVALGVSPFNYPTPPDFAYSFQLINGTIRVIVDTTPTPTLVLTSVDNAVGTTTVYHGTITGGASNAYIGYKFLIAGFGTNQNNGTFVCTASSATTLTLANAAGISETHAATALSSGAVYWDKLDGTVQILFSKSPGAGQSYFIGSGGILFSGNGVDTWKWTPLNTFINPSDPNGQSVWNWGIVAPEAQPSVTVVASGSASTPWTGTPTAVVWSTMGLVDDTANSAVYQLISVNYTGTNATNFGTTGNGQPAWAGTGGTTVDNTVTWSNLGPLVLWTANTKFASAQSGGVSGYSCAVYDPTTKAVYVQISGTISTSGNQKPNFVAGVNQKTHNDGQCTWLYSGTPGTWKAGAVIPAGAAGNSNTANFITQPGGIANGLSTTGTTYLMFSGAGGTTAASATSPFSATTLSPLGFNVAGDGDMIWMALGTYTRNNGTPYIGWTAVGQAFSVIKVTVSAVDYWQVCTTGGTSGSLAPNTAFNSSTTTSVVNNGGVSATYNLTASATGIPINTAGASSQLTITGFTNPGNNGTFNVLSVLGTTVTVDNTGAVNENLGAPGSNNVVYNPWGTLYKQSTSDGHVVWTCVGKVVNWAASTRWYLPPSGFTPPSVSSPFGGASVLDSNSNIEFCISSGLGGVVAPTWNTTAGGPMTGTGNSATTDNNAIWYNNGPVAAESLVWAKGYAYAYSYKARATDDFYSAAPLGGGNIPPGITSATSGGLNNFNWGLNPQGSMTEAVSSASPANTSITSASPGGGAVNTISGVGSTDPQVDTIIIWRSADGTGSGNMFELTEIPNPSNGAPWTFKDFLPDAPTANFPGLNNLIPAPINDVNNPPLAGLLPMAYNFQRIWCADGQFVPYSGGQDTKVGNPDEAFNPLSSLPFLAPVTRLVKTSQGLVTFLTDSIEVIAGGPAASSFFSVTWAPGIGLLSYNALDVFAGEIYFFSSDNQFRVMTPSLNIQNAGFPLGDQFANQPTSGVSDATWNSANVYVASHQSGTDNAIFVSDGSTGWYRLNPRQAGATSSPEPVWSPFAVITNGARMVQSVETVPGVKKLLVGSSAQTQPLLVRSQTVYTDNGTPYDAYFEMGNITLAHPGQLAVLKFCEFDFNGVGFQPTISYLLNEVSGAFVPFTAVPQFDPPSIYGKTISPISYSPNRYYFAGNASLARCRHLRLKVDYGTTSNGDEMYNATIFGRLMIEM